MRTLFILVFLGATAMAEEGSSRPWDGTVTITAPIGTISKQYIWEPRPDITTYELAVAMPLLFSRSWNASQAVEAAPPEVRRHFREVR